MNTVNINQLREGKRGQAALTQYSDMVERRANGDATERRNDSPSLLRATEDKVMMKRGVL